MSQENGQQFIQEDEIDLRELWKKLMKRKMFIVLFTALVTGVAIAYALLVKPIYEVKSNVQIGYIGADLVADPDTLVKMLNLVFNVEDKVKTEDEFVSEVSSISGNKKLKNFIEIKTQALSNEEALKKNEEVVKYIQEQYQPKMAQYLTNTKNSIDDKKRTLLNVDAFETKNIQEQIKLLKFQRIVEIDEKIKFLKETKLKAIEAKIDFHSKKLQEYTKAINKLINHEKVSSDAEYISSMQMVNYQNLILNSQNNLEDLKLEKETIKTQSIPALQREKENISSDTIRKLQHQIDVDLVTKKIQLKEQIERLNYNMSEQNVQNSKVIGEYVIKDYPVKPKKKLIVIVAFVTGLMLSVFLAFFLEFIKGSRKEEF